jgi:class 3 adenylate cyclase
MAARKTVTVVFCDIANSTPLGEALDPEVMRTVMEHYFAVVRRELERHGGTVEKFIGDAVMAVFGIPTVHDDDALRAVRAAVDMRTALGGLNQELERQQGQQWYGVSFGKGNVLIISPYLVQIIEADKDFLPPALQIPEELVKGGLSVDKGRGQQQ